MSKKNPTFYIETLGCPKNLVDSRRMRFSLLEAGFEEAQKKENADIILINSCSFIREAQEETIETTFEYLKLKEKRPHLKVGLIGCFVERFEKETRQEIPEIDFLVGTGRYGEMGQLLARELGFFPKNLKEKNYINPKRSEKKPYAYFKISEGCSRHCSFCVIPQIRGKFQAHSLFELKRQWDEEKKLHKEIPLREVILVSQDTINQGVAELEEIIAFFHEKEEVRWIRLHYLFPDKRLLKLLDLWQKYPKIVSYLDMPIQHASPTVLKRMGRPADLSLIRDILQKARAIRPNMEVRSSFIIGFPEETEEEYQELFTFLEENPIEKLALFRYSHEFSSRSFSQYRDTVPEKIKTQRINELRQFHLEMRKNWRARLIGQRERVLVEEINKREIIARRQQDSPEIDEVVFITPLKQNLPSLKVGDFLEIEILDTFEYDYSAILVN